MPPIQIKRYPNRRYYARHESKYVSLQQIEQMVKEGQAVEISDSQSGADLTRLVLTQIITERQPEKMRLFPVDMLHFIVRSNDFMMEFLGDYFRHSLTYLNYLQRHSGSKAKLVQPIHWVTAWLDGMRNNPGASIAGDSGTGEVAPDELVPGERAPHEPVSEERADREMADREIGNDERSGKESEEADRWALRIEMLERRIHQLESRDEPN